MSFDSNEDWALRQAYKEGRESRDAEVSDLYSRVAELERDEELIRAYVLHALDTDAHKYEQDPSAQEWVSRLCIEWIRARNERRELAALRRCADILQKFHHWIPGSQNHAEAVEALDNLEAARTGES